MGRKKIKIRPIKDDRNRAVTFLKRKNGLFKKAFELAVLCRAEVAVIVFAGNKKLYEFASNDIKDVLFRYTQAPEPYEHRGPEDFQNNQDGDSDDSDDMGLDDAVDYQQRVMSHTPQPHATPSFTPHMGHQRRTSDDSIVSDRRQSLQHHVGTPQLLPSRTPPIHTRHPSLQHLNTPPQHFQVPLNHAHGSPQPPNSGLRGGMMQGPLPHGVGEGMGLGIGMNAPQPYGVNYNPYGHQQVYITPENVPRRPSSNPTYQYTPPQHNPYQPSPPLSHSHQVPQPEPSPQMPQQPQVTEIKSKGRMKSIHTPVSSRASSLAAHFEPSRSQYDRQQTQSSLPRSHSVDSAALAHQQVVPSVPFSSSPPPITTTTPGSTSNSIGTGQRPKLSLHIPDDEDPQAEESVGSATPGTNSPELNRSDRPDIKSEQLSSAAADDDSRDRRQEPYFLPPPTSATLLPNGRLPGPALGGFDNSNNSGGTPLSALPSRYAGDMLPSPSTFYPEFYGTLPSAGTSNLRSGFGGLMNGTPVVARADEASSFGYSGEKRSGEQVEIQPTKRPRT